MLINQLISCAWRNGNDVLCGTSQLVFVLVSMGKLQNKHSQTNIQYCKQQHDLIQSSKILTTLSASSFRAYRTSLADVGHPVLNFYVIPNIAHLFLRYVVLNTSFSVVFTS